MPRNYVYIAHRASGFGYPESSEAALKAALQSEADEVELDLRGYSNGEYVVSHWPCFHLNLKRLLTLERVLDLVTQSGKGLRLDLKSGGLHAPVVAAVAESGYLPRTVFMSQDTRSLSAVKKANPDAKLSRSLVLTGLSQYLDWHLYQHALSTLSASNLTLADMSLTLARISGKFSERILEDGVKKFREVAACIHHAGEISALNAKQIFTILSKTPLR